MLTLSAPGISYTEVQVTYGMRCHYHLYLTHCHMNGKRETEYYNTPLINITYVHVF